MRSPISVSEVGKTRQRMSPSSDWMFDGESHHLVLGRFDQESAGLLGVQ